MERARDWSRESATCYRRHITSKSPAIGHAQFASADESVAILCRVNETLLIKTPTANKRDVNKDSQQPSVFLQSTISAFVVRHGQRSIVVWPKLSHKYFILGFNVLTADCSSISLKVNIIKRDSKCDSAPVTGKVN